MPIVTLTPNTLVAEAFLRAAGKSLRKSFRRDVLRTWEVPDEDVLVRINRCTTLVRDPNSASVDIWVEMNPDPNLEVLADKLRDVLAKTWVHTMSGISAEIWIRFIPGSWCGVNLRGEVYDSVDHVGSETLL